MSQLSLVGWATAPIFATRTCIFAPLDDCMIASRSYADSTVPVFVTVKLLVVIAVLPKPHLPQPQLPKPQDPKPQDPTPQEQKPHDPKPQDPNPQLPTDSAVGSNGFTFGSRNGSREVPP